GPESRSASRRPRWSTSAWTTTGGRFRYCRPGRLPGDRTGIASVEKTCRPVRTSVKLLLVFGSRSSPLQKRGSMAFSTSHLYFDDVEVGQEWESSGRTVTEADVVNFAGVSGDFNPIHMDHEFAKTTPFRRPIAHGLLVFAIGSGLGVMCPPMRTVAFLQVREW